MHPWDAIQMQIENNKVTSEPVRSQITNYIQAVQATLEHSLALT